jgi:hypothetical protein
MINSVDDVSNQNFFSFNQNKTHNFSNILLKQNNWNSLSFDTEDDFHRNQKGMQLYLNQELIF